MFIFGTQAYYFYSDYYYLFGGDHERWNDSCLTQSFYNHYNFYTMLCHGDATTADQR